jgi:predicted TIM-barrel fold metal-dependent hydrolase
MAEIEAGEYVDVYVNLPDKERANEEDLDPNIRQWFLKNSPHLLGGVTPDQMVERMTNAGIEKGLLNWSAGPGRGDPGPPSPTIPRTVPLTLDEFREKAEEVANICKDFPGRLYPTCNVDPNYRMDAVRMVEIAVKEYDFRAVRVFPAYVNMAATDPLCYPIYTKCIELDVPVVINCGFPGPIRFARLQRTINLDDICVTFPELMVVATHVGHPWHLETLALLQKHQNFRLMTSGFVPKYIPDEIIYTMNTRAQHKVMFSADYAVNDFQHCVDEALNLPLREGVLRRYMRENALETFRID